MELLNYIVWNPNHTALSFGSFEIRWYALCWMIGLALAYLLVKRIYKEQKIKDELFDPLFLYCFVGILAGARLGHCIFYEPQTYLTSVKNGVTAGNIYDRAGVLLASTDPETGKRVYNADEALRRSVAHVVGTARGTVKNAIESFMAEYLYGGNMTYIERFNQTMQGNLRGDNVKLTIDSGLSAYIASIFPEGKSGAAVVMNYKTGEIYAMNSFPTFDPMSSTYVGINTALNRATRWLSAPGSTFKIVTLAAALENIPGVEERTFLCEGGVTFGEHQRTVRDYGGSVHGEISLRKAFIQSCNSTFAMLAGEMGDKALRRTAADFGIGDDFTFRDLVVENSAFAVTDRELLGADLAWTGAGQHQLGISPLHMCMIAAGIANDGVMMEPRLLLSATSPAGKTRAAFESIQYRTLDRKYWSAKH